MICFQIGTDGFLESREHHFVAAKSPEKRILFQFGYQFTLSSDDSGLRTAEKFVSTDAYEIHFVRENPCGSWLMLERCQQIGCHHCGAPKIYDHRKVELTSQCNKLCRAGLCDKAFHVEI